MAERNTVYSTEERRMPMRYNYFSVNGGKLFTLAAVLMVTLLFIFVPRGQAGWRFDANRFASSVHGQTGCLDCHSELADIPRHPDPAKVNMKAASFFNPETCYSCHDDIEEKLADGRHGRQQVQDPLSFSDCTTCHDPHGEGAAEELPSAAITDLSEGDLKCLKCHGKLPIGATRQVVQTHDLCFTCHTKTAEEPTSAVLIDREAYSHTPHAKLDCLVCHPGADAFGHDQQPLGDCRQCHTLHKESVTHDVHADVSCQACHLNAVSVLKDQRSGTITWQGTTATGAVSGLHMMRKPECESCTRCHYEGTPVGASEMVLPAKGVFCMPCHAATVSVGDAITAISLLMFLLGTAALSSLYFSGFLQEGSGSGILSRIKGVICG